MQQVLFPAYGPTVTLPPNSTSKPSLDSYELQWLGDRLRLTYGPVETTLPARLAELAERLARREQGRE